MPPEWRTYRLVKLTGRLPSEIDEEPAYALDFLLAIEETIASLKGGQ